MRTCSKRGISRTFRTFRTALFRVRVNHLNCVHGITNHDEGTFIAIFVGQIFNPERAVALPRLKDCLDTGLVLFDGKSGDLSDYVTDPVLGLDTIPPFARCKRAVKSVCIGGTARCGLSNSEWYQANLAKLMAYLLKGSDQETAARLGLDRWGEGGRIIGKRASTTVKATRLGRTGCGIVR